MKAELSTACSKCNLHLIREFVQNSLVNTHVPHTLLPQVVLAVDEACANAMIHGNSCDKGKKLRITLELSDSKLQCWICDVGQYERMDRSKTLHQSTQEILNSGKQGGLGMFLIHSIMDKVEFYTRDRVNFCHLTKKIA